MTEAKRTVIENATVVNTRDGSLSPHKSIVLEGGKIQRIAEAGSIPTEGNTQTVDASGKYVVPGFLDMHVHALLHGYDFCGADGKASFFPMMLAHGITGFREMVGFPAIIERARRLNAASREGAVDAPEVLQVAGDLFGDRAVGSPDLAVQKVRQQKELGGDFVKVVGLRNEEVFLATLAEAKRQGFGVAGHLEPTISAVKASNAGMTAIEHLGILASVFFDCSSEEVEVRKEEAALPAMPPVMPITTAEARDEYAAASSPDVRPVPLEWLTASPMLFRPSAGPLVKRLFETYSEEKARTVARALVKNGTWNVPTLIRGRTMQFTDDPYYREHPDLKYLEAGRRALWETIAQAYSRVVPPQANAAFRKFYELQAKTAAIFREEGVRMLAGTDLGGIWVVPGCSLHHEFRMLAEAGFSPLEILQMTTLNGAAFLHREDTMGTVDEGKDADLVLLGANPIEDVANLGKISGVVLKGRHYPQAALEKMKQDVEEACRN